MKSREGWQGIGGNIDVSCTSNLEDVNGSSERLLLLLRLTVGLNGLLFTSPRKTDRSSFESESDLLQGVPSGLDHVCSGVVRPVSALSGCTIRRRFDVQM